MIRVILTFLFLVEICYAQVDIIRPTQNHPTSFAIFIDRTTFNKVDSAVYLYRNSVEYDGLSTYIVIDEWKKPDDVKKEILKLYKLKPQLEGIVLIGNIPIPMIRNAHHLTSSYKLNKATSLLNTSVPSDRFYDDFDLKFKYIKQDREHPLYHYYSLLPDSPQKINKEIYSARIKPAENEFKYDVLRNYLIKVANAKNKIDYLDNAFVYTGSGYHSESLTSWGDEQLALKESFPQLYKPGGRLKKLNFTMNTNIKETILNELQDKNLDFAIFHAHGEEDYQRLIENDKIDNIYDNIEAVKLYLRNKLREAANQHRSVENVKEHYINLYGISEKWFDGAFDIRVMEEDSLALLTKTISSSDVKRIASAPELILFDQCSNGSFQLDDYIAGDYIFGEGSTVAAIANSSETLQDQWSHELGGLLEYGIRFGQWHRMNNLMESHLIGDPTFHFFNRDTANINLLIVQQKSNIELWRELSNSDAIPLRLLGIRMLFMNLGKEYEDELVNLYKTEESYNIRLLAIKCLAELNTEKFEDLLKDSINDPFEFIRRMSAIWMGKVGRSDFLSLMAKQILRDESERVIFNLKRSIVLIDPVAAYDACVEATRELPGTADKDKLIGQFKTSLLSSNKWMNENLASIKNDTLRIRTKVRDVKAFRNYSFIPALPTLIELAKSGNEAAEVRISILEALGWYGFVHNKEIILNACDEIINQTENPEEVKEEALRTKNRIIEGVNNPLTS